MLNVIYHHKVEKILNVTSVSLRYNSSEKEIRFSQSIFVSEAEFCYCTYLRMMAINWLILLRKN